MSRLPELTTKEVLPTAAHRAFDSIAQTRNRVGGPFAVMMHSPDVAERSAHLGTYLRFESSLPKPIIELATIVAARECECDYEWRAHSRLALEAGIPQWVIDVVEQGIDSKDLDDDFALVIRYGRDLLAKHRVDDATFSAVRSRFGDRGVVDLTATFGYYSLLACVLNAVEVHPRAGG